MFDRLIYILERLQITHRGYVLGRTLESLSDHQLRDIGLERNAIDEAVAAARQSLLDSQPRAAVTRQSSHQPHGQPVCG